MKPKRKRWGIGLSIFLSIVFLLGAINPLSTNITLTEVPYPMDYSNQAGWWSPLETYGSTKEYAYLVYNAPGSTNDKHTVKIAKRDGCGNWSNLPIMDGNTAVEYPDDLGHNQPSMARDGDGYFHVFASMHNNSWRYFRSDQVGSAPQNHSDELPDSNLTFTYPIVATAPNGDLYLIARASENDRRSGRLYHWDNKLKSWKRVAIFASESKKSVYPNDIQVDAAGNVHILFEWSTYPSSGLRHELSYLKYSPSTGKFYKADNTPVSAPVTTATADVIQPLATTEQYIRDYGDPGGPGVQSGKLTLDHNNQPQIVYRYRSPYSGSIFTIQYAYFRNGQWQRETAHSSTQTKVAVDITWDGTKSRVYYVLSSGPDRVFATTKDSRTWTPISLAPGKPIERLAVEQNANGTDILYLVDSRNLKLYYGRFSVD